MKPAPLLQTQRHTLWATGVTWATARAIQERLRISQLPFPFDDSAMRKRLMALVRRGLIEKGASRRRRDPHLYKLTQRGRKEIM